MSLGFAFQTFLRKLLQICINRWRRVMIFKKKRKKAMTHSTQGWSSVYLPLLETERLAQRWDFCMCNCFPARTCTFTCALLSTRAAAYQLQRNQTKSDAQTYIKHFDTAGLLHHQYKTKQKTDIKQNPLALAKKYWFSLHKILQNALLRSTGLPLLNITGAG